MLKGKKTITFHTLVFLAGAMEEISDTFFIPNGTSGGWFMAIGVIGIILRWLTTTPIFSKEQ